MNYALVATPKYLLCVDLNKKTATPIEGSRGEYYGISWFPNTENLVLSHSALDNTTLVDVAAYAQSEVGYVSAGTQRSKSFLSQPHQLFCAPDNRIICTNTGRNAITVIDLEKPGTYQEATVSEARWDRLSLEERIGDHLNSVFLKDNQLFVICHRFNKGSCLATFAYPSLELISVKKLNGVTGLHNIWVTDEGQQISCNSEAGNIVDLVSEEILWQSGMPIYTRGLAASKEYILVGESQKVGRNIRSSSMSGLWILERSTWKVMDYICLGPFGCVNEVRLLDVADEAHHGHPYEGLSKLLQSNMYQDLAEQSMTRYVAMATANALWKNYVMRFGAPTLLPDGAKKAEEDMLCLATLCQETSSLAFDYSLLPTATPSHVSAVINYQGTADDTNMHAILVQKNGDQANLSIWQHDGIEWRHFPEITALNLPLSGRLAISCNKEISVWIQNKEILRIKPEKINLEQEKPRLGIRWIGATVKPE